MIICPTVVISLAVAVSNPAIAKAEPVVLADAGMALCDDRVEHHGPARVDFSGDEATCGDARNRRMSVWDSASSHRSSSA